MELSTTTIAVLLGAAILLGSAAVVVSVVALRGQRRVRASYQVFSGGSRDDVLSLLHRHIEQVRELRGEVGALRDHGYGVREMVAGCISRVHTVRYDAFDDMGGHLSFSTALLDEHGDGLILTAINGRNEARIYAKPVRAGDSRSVSDEEARAIRQALAGGSESGEEQMGRRGPRVIRDAS